jgi:GNAT superfamily N-acetyltransferase
VTDTQIIVARTDDEIDACYPVMAQLRPHIAASEFRSRVQALEQTGYRLAYLEDEGAVRCVAGFRPIDHLWSGKVLYIDDLVTDEAHRRKGSARRMFAWLIEHARADGCVALHLESGVHRAGAHRFYFAQHMSITDFHFELPLTSPRS